MYSHRAAIRSDEIGGAYQTAEGTEDAPGAARRDETG